MALTRSILLSGFAAGAWLLTGALVYQMLSGTFAVRTCQTDCVQALAQGALAVAVAGLLFGVYTLTRERNVLSVVAFLFLAALLGVFAVTAVIGNV